MRWSPAFLDSGLRISREEDGTFSVYSKVEASETQAAIARLAETPVAVAAEEGRGRRRHPPHLAAALRGRPLRRQRVGLGHPVRTVRMRVWERHGEASEREREMRERLRKRKPRVTQMMIT